MDIIKLEGTEDTPMILLDPKNKIFEISGRSLPEDCSEFYKPILNWFREYVKTDVEDIIFDFKFEYFNTASSKIILDILLILEALAEKGCSVKIIWHYQADDEDMMEAGEEFGEIVEVPIELREC